jgi:hypothetical protein
VVDGINCQLTLLCLVHISVKKKTQDCTTTQKVATADNIFWMEEALLSHKQQSSKFKEEDVIFE